MAESRRVQLSTLTSVARAPNPEPPSGPVPEQSAAADSRSVRLVLHLFEPDEQNFPEFSYSQLVEDQISQTKRDAPLCTLEEKEMRENDEVAAIARRLVAKYGRKPIKRKDRIQDLIDIGYGYDEEDTFIDNSEAYDEFVPASITTKFGGFYVNSGQLQFRQASDTETDEMMVGKKTSKQKKQKFPGGQDTPKMKRRRVSGENKSSEHPNARKRCDIDPAHVMKTKHKKPLSVTRMLKKFQREKEREGQKMETQREAAVVGAAETPPFPADAAGGGGLALADPLLSLIGLTNDQALIQAASTVDFNLDLHTLLDVSEETSVIQPDQSHPSGLASNTVKNPTNSQPTLLPEQSQPPSEGGSTSLNPCTQLPDGLPARLEESIRKLTVAAKTSEGESKLKFFSPDINSILLDIELQCREQAGPLRSKVYTHLSSFLPCSRDTLLKRAKRLVVTHTEENLGEEDTMKKLREALGRSMPEQIACFTEHCQAYEQIKSSKAANEDNVDEKSGRIGPPRKIFKWNEEIRECLSLMLNDRINKYKKEGLEMEEYLKTLLDNEVKPLWPKGWMQSRLLLSESRKLLGLVPPLPVKRAKTEKKQSDLSESSAAADLRADVPPADSRGFSVPVYVPPAVTEKVRKEELAKGLEVDAPPEPDRAGVRPPSAPTPRFPRPPPEVDPSRPPAAGPGALRVSAVNRATPPQLLQPGGVERAEEVQIYIISDDDDDDDGCIVTQ